MSSAPHVAGPEACGLDPVRVGRLLDAAAATLAGTSGCACQLALARHGELAAFAAFGEARFEGELRPADTRSLFCVYSVTKAITSAASWILLQEGTLRLDDRVADRIPGFEAHGKGAVRVEHLLTHQAGFPRAQLDPLDWLDPKVRLARFAQWPLEWEPGSRFIYHGVSSMWVLRELVERAAGCDLGTFVRERIAIPLGLTDLHLGLPAAERKRRAEVVCIGEPPSEAQRERWGIQAPAIPDHLLPEHNDPARLAVGSPAGGAVATAAEIARFYQGVLADASGRGPGIWQPGMLVDAMRPRDADFVDPMTGQPALRGLGVVVAGRDAKIFRGFPQAASPRAIGHLGAGGQIAWADPDSGLSFAYVTNGAHRDPVAQGALGLGLSTKAAECPRG
jgi:CubicO group peptidase (beta-lactamase class C family)